MEPALAESKPCSLYPIALSSISLKRVAVGGIIGDIYNGAQPGNFGWLTWTGNLSEPALAASLTPPGDSSTYINPNNPSDHEISVGDWVRGKPGVSNSRSVRDALEALKARDIIVPVWNEARGQGSNTLYRVGTFAQVRLLSYQLPGQNRISARFLGYTECPIPVNKAPQVNAGPDQSITLPNVATLNGTVSDDGLPTGSTITTLWSKVSGPGAVTFDGSNRTVATASFSLAGTYVLRLTASDSQLTSSDDVIVTVNQANQAPVVNAGPDQSINLPDEAQLNGGATDDGQPAGSTLTTVWSKVSGPGIVSFDNPNSTVTTATFSATGTYVLRLTASDSALTTSDELVVTVKSKPFSSRVYTLNADFDEGSVINVVHSVPDQLQLDDMTRAFGFIWVAVSTKGTIVKINTETGEVLGEYYTSPEGQPKDPSRTTVDHGGNVWAANRAGNSVVHIGLIENGQCVDRNGNGVIDTSHGLNDLRRWSNNNVADTEGGVSTAEDECVLHYTRVHSSGTRHVSVDRNNDVWVSGIGGKIFDLIDGKTGLIKRTEGPVGYGGYGGLIDRFGVIWSARPLLRWDTSKPLSGPYGMNWISYGHDSYGLCIDSQGNVWNTEFGRFIWKFAPDGRQLGVFDHGNRYAQGCVVDKNDDVWVAHSLSLSSVGHLKNDGTLVGVVTVGVGPTGVAVDAVGKIWATNYNSRTVSRINPNAGPIGADGITRVGEVDFTTVDLGGNLYNYSDMTGSTLTGAPGEGTWSTVFDSNLAGAEWGSIGWTARVCGDGALTVSVASSEDGATFSPAETVTSGADPSIPNGRYLKISVNFRRATSGESPVLYDLSVGTQGFTLPVSANAAPAVDAGQDQTITLPNPATLRGTACDDAMPSGSRLTVSWQKVSGPGGVIFSSPESLNTTATFSTHGTYVLRLTASDTQSSASDDLTVTVNPAPPDNQPPTANAGPDQTMAFLGTPNSKGNIVVNHDEWTISNKGFDSAPDTAQFVRNLANLFTGGKPGKFLAYSSNFSVTDEQLISTMTNAGHVYTVSTSAEISLANLLQYDAVFLGGDPVDNTVLIEYMKAGGNVYLALGTGVGGAYAEAARWNTFLNAFDLNTQAEYNLISGVFPVSSQHPIFAGVHSLFYGNGQSVNRLSLSAAHTAVLESGFFGVYQANARSQLSGAVTDDGLPAGSTLASSWSKVSGPGLVTFDNAVAAITTGIFSEPGNYVLRLTADDSQLSGSDDVVISLSSPEVVNQSPIVDAGPEQTIALAGGAWLSGASSDDGLPLGSTLTFQWSKVSGPGSVAFSNPNQSTSNATFSTAGTYILQLQASDTQLTSSDTVIINVSADNQAPVVNTGPDQIVAFGDAVSLGGTAADDGRPTGSTLSVTWAKVSGPGAVTFANANQPATTATFSDGGRYVLRLTASDSQLTTNDDITVTVNRAPVVNAGPDQTITLPSTATLNYTVTDDGLPAGSTTVTWNKVSGPGTVSFANAGESSVTATFGEAGTYVLRLSADDSHLTAADDVTVTVNAAEPPPLVSIISPLDESTLTTRTDVIGSVSGGTWNLEHSLTGDEGAPTEWTTFASGLGPVSNARLGVFDPTLLLNGRYLIRLSTTRNGQTSSASVSVIVSEEQKIGNFTITFSDLSVPVAGLPIEVTRTYDSRDKRQGDFGIGWTLGVRNVRVQESRAAGAQWQGVVSGPAQFPTYCISPSKPHVVTVTLADNRVYKFEATLSPGNGCQALAPLQEVTLGFRPLPGTNATLTPVGENPLLVAGPFPGALQLLDGNAVAPVDYDQYQLTLEDGTELLIDQHAGLQRMTDINGNTLTINNNGIIHSGGKSISFTRDTQGRITQITDPAGNSMSYAYDANGDMVSFKDREGNTTTYTYNSTHGLLTINDPRGTQPLRNEYDAEGRLVKQIDAFGKEVRFTHNLDARQETVFDRLGRATVYDYDARGNVLRVQDADGKVTTRTYDERDNLLSETNALGKTTTYTYDAQDNRLSETDALNHKTEYTYNSRKQVLTIKDPAGGVTTYTYDSNGNQTSVKDALGHTTSATYSTNGLQLMSIDALNNTTSFEYDASGNLIKQTDPLGNVTTYTYDANGNRLTESQTRTIGGVTETLTTTFQYDKLGRQTKVTYPDSSTTETLYNSIGKQSATIDQLGRRTSYEYDAMGRLVRTIYPDGTEEKSEYDFEGRRTKSIDRAGRATTYAYDSIGRLEKITLPDNSTTTNTYDAVGQVTATTDALNHITRYEYDAAGRRTKVINALNNETVFDYDANGNQISVKDAKGNVTTYTYDANNQRTQVKFPDTTMQTTVYDKLGQVITKIDQAGVRTGYEYDKRGKLIKVTDALGGVTSYTYDEQGNQLAQTDANNHTTSYSYDRMGRRTKRALPLGMSETYAYDLAGNLTSRTDFRGKTTTFLYDVMNRLQSKTPDASLGETAVTFTYTATGQRKTMADASGTTIYTYNTRDRLASKATPQGTLTYTYDSAGNVKSVSSLNASGVTVNYNYDVLNRLETVTDNRLAAGANMTAYTYDLNGNLESTTYPNAVRTTYTYNSLNRLTNVNAAKGATLANYTYTLGESGNRLSVTETDNRTVTYTYDALYRLTGETISNDTVAPNNGSINYTYDAVGNRLNRTSTVGAIPAAVSAYDANDRLTTDTYDPSGNTTVSNGNTYSYDFENRLTSLNGGAVTFVYDGDGNRVAKTIGGVTTKYLIDTNNHTGHAQVVEELIGSSVQRTYTYGLDLINQNQFLGGAWAVSFYGIDGVGSVRFLTNASGSITDTYDYDAFGNLIAQSGATPNDYLFTGEQYDPNLGFYYLRSRYYEQGIGRFLTPDRFPSVIFDPQTLHRYSYVMNNPVNLVDPSGKFASLSEVTSVEALMEEVTFVQIASSIAFTVFKGGALASGLPFMAIGFAYQESALNILTAEPNKMEYALELYDDGSRFIELGARFGKEFYKRVGYIESATGLLNLARSLGSLSLQVKAVNIHGHSVSLFRQIFIKKDRFTIEHQFKANDVVRAIKDFEKVALDILRRISADNY